MGDIQLFQSKNGEKYILTFGDKIAQFQNCSVSSSLGLCHKSKTIGESTLYHAHTLHSPYFTLVTSLPHEFAHFCSN
jgi:hypothetical protein